MYLVLLLLVPLLIGVVGLFWSKGRVTIKEFIVLEVACILVVGIGFSIARYAATADNEIWSGRITKKKQVEVPCSHSYRCNPHPCEADVKDTCYDTCYEHFNDWDWNIYTSNSEVITIDRIDRRGSSAPPHWEKAFIGEATALSHHYENYIKAHPDSILRRTGAGDRFRELLPKYPHDIYDYYRCDRFLVVGLTEPKAREWNWLLTQANSNLGKKKQVNIIVVVVNTGDSSYSYALEEAWIGGKKNDLIVIMGITNYPTIDWVQISSWSKSEDLKVELRDAIMEVGTLDERDKIVNLISSHIDKKFVRRPMDDFKYLAAGIQPGTVGTIILFSLGLLTSGGLMWYFYNEDPFGGR